MMDCAPHTFRVSRDSFVALERRALTTRSTTRGGDYRIPNESAPRENVTRVRLGSYEFRKKGVSRFDLRDPYYLAITLTWPQFLAGLLALYLTVNVVFATLYWLVPGSVANARPTAFADVFFISIETMATVGYGEMYPATAYGHTLAAIEIVCGVAFTAILTGLTFVRFSQPRAKLVFAANPVVTMRNGKPTLMVRIGNGRVGVLANVFSWTPARRACGPAALRSSGSNGRTFRSLRPFGHSCMSWTSRARCAATTRRERSKRTHECS
jgi:inward rectifier potassium channel